MRQFRAQKSAPHGQPDPTTPVLLLGNFFTAFVANNLTLFRDAEYGERVLWRVEEGTSVCIDWKSFPQAKRRQRLKGTILSKVFTRGTLDTG